MGFPEGIGFGRSIVFNSVKPPAYVLHLFIYSKKPALSTQVQVLLWFVQEVDANGRFYFKFLVRVGSMMNPLPLGEGPT